MIANQWSARLRATGVKQTEVAARLGYTAQAVYQALQKGDPRYTELVRALELMTPEMRAAWVSGAGPEIPENPSTN